TARYHLEPLERDELRSYVAHRLAVAGARGAIFGRAALGAVWKHSGGIPRRVNILCDRALLGAWSAEAREVSAALVRKAAREISAPPRASRATPRAVLLVAAILLAGAVGVSIRPAWIARVDASAPRAAPLDAWLETHA